MASKLIFLPVGCLLLFGAGVLAADRAHPDFSGTWTLDASKSDFGPMPVPVRMLDLIEQTAGGMKVKRLLANEEREANYEFSYKFDGSEVVNESSANHSRSRARWDGDALVVETQLEVEGLPLKIVDKWLTSSECGCLLISRQFHSKQGELHMRLVMLRKN